MPQQRLDVLAKLEHDVLDRTVPLADVLLTCLFLARQTQAGRLLDWATAEQKGYRQDAVPDYRKVAAPILWAFDVPYRGIVMQPVNVHDLPEAIREHINEIVSLNQPVAELEALASQCESQNRQLELEVFCGDLLMAMWNQNHPYGRRALAMYWSIHPAVIRGVLGQVRTALAEFVGELRAEIGDSDQLPSAAQADEALRAAVPSAIFNHSTVTIVHATNQTGDIVPEGPRTTIKGNKTTIKDSRGNFAVASEHVTQMNNDGLDLDGLRRFAELVTQVAPTLGLAPEQQAALRTGAEELQAAIAGTDADRGRIRRTIDKVLKVLRATGPSAARAVAIGMGDELMRELGGDVIHHLGH